MPAFEHIVVERHERIFLVRINRPEVLNAISYETTLELDAAWREFADDPDLWVGILTGTGERAFSAGADLKARARTGLVEHAEQATVPFGGITGERRTWKPLIAAINGLALGGGLEMALACDLRVAVPQAQLGLPETRWALIAGAGGLIRLPRLVPFGTAMEMVLLAKRLTADEALGCGLVNAVVPAGDLLSTTFDWASRICELGPLAIRASIELLYRGTDLPLNDGLALDDDFVRAIVASEDAREGVRAFGEKRAPRYQAR
jgi:enoyl-CoA hydratase/carnithine racemase